MRLGDAAANLVSGHTPLVRGAPHEPSATRCGTGDGGAVMRSALDPHPAHPQCAGEAKARLCGDPGFRSRTGLRVEIPALILTSARPCSGPRQTRKRGRPASMVQGAAARRGP